MKGNAITNLVMVGHSEEKSFLKKPLCGEIFWGKKVKELAKSRGIDCVILDIYDLLGKHPSLFEHWKKMESINSFFALEEESLFEDFGEKELIELKLSIESYLNPDSLLIFFSWDRLLAAFLGLGLQKKFPLIARCTHFHEEERLSLSLYQSVHLILTESPMTSRALLNRGIEKNKILFFPPLSKPVSQAQINQEKILENLSAQLNRSIPPSSFVLGIYSRLIPSKNVEPLLEILDELWKDHPQFIVILRGDFDPSGDGGDFEGYSEALKLKMESWKKKPWLLWLREPLEHEKVMEEYSACDLLISFSGSEGGSQTVSEWIGLGKAVVLLEASSQPSLFSKAACFIKAEKNFFKSSTWFKKPDIADAKAKIGQLIACSDTRKSFEKKAREVAHLFGEEQALKRLELIIGKNLEGIAQQFDEDLRVFYG